MQNEQKLLGQKAPVFDYTLRAIVSEDGYFFISPTLEYDF